MIRKKVLGVGVSSATMLVQDTEAGGVLRVLKRINVSSMSAEEATEAYELYKSLHQAKIPLMVELHTVLLQNSFLNLVTSYCSEGNLEDFVENDACDPIDEKTAARWLLVIAKVIEEVQKLAMGGSCCFFGLALDRIFPASRTPEGLRVGLPVPRASYFKWLAEREALGVAVGREYPPEVTRSPRQYHPRASDVWHLGLLGMKLLGAHASYSQRSSHVRALITAMMEPSVERRPAIAGVVRALTEFTGGNNSNHNNTGRNGVPRPIQAGVAMMISSSSSEGFATPVSPITAPRATAPTSDNSGGDENEVLVPSNRVTPTKAREAARAARHKVPESWHRRVLEQFEELQRMNASPPRGRSRIASPSGQKQRSLSLEEQLLSARGSGSGGQVTNLEGIGKKRLSGGGRMPERRREGNVKSFSPAGRGKKRGSGSGSGGGGSGPSPTNKVQYMLSQQIEEERRRSLMKQDQDEKKWKQQEKERAALDAHRNHMDKLKKIRSKRGEETKNDIRKYIKQWRDQRTSLKDDNIIVTDISGVAVFAPKSGPPPSQKNPQTSSSFSPPPSKTRKQSEVTQQQQQQQMGNRISSIDAMSPFASTIGATGERLLTTPPPLRPVSVPGRLRSPPRVGPARSTSIYRQRGVSPHVPRTRANLDNTNSSTENANNVKTLTMTTGSPGKPNDSNGWFTSNANGNDMLDIPKSLLSSTDIYNISAGNDLTNGEKRSGEAFFASIEFTANSIRNSLSQVLLNRQLCLEALDVVDAFVLRSESERQHPRFNVVFAKTLRELLADENLFLAALPMCSQLVALQGLLQPLQRGGKVEPIKGMK